MTQVLLSACTHSLSKTSSPAIYWHERNGRSAVDSHASQNHLCVSLPLYYRRPSLFGSSKRTTRKTTITAGLYPQMWMQPFSLLQKAAAPGNSDVANTESKTQALLLPSESNIASRTNLYCSTRKPILLYLRSNIALLAEQYSSFHRAMEAAKASTEAIEKEFK